MTESEIGARLLARARAIGARSLAVVGTSKNAGKSVTVNAICAALRDEGTTFGLASTGRDGEAYDVVEAIPKPRFRLDAGTLVATAEALLQRREPVEILERTGERGALGEIVIARVAAPGFFEVSGAAHSAAMRRIVARLAERTAFVVLDGAVDRIAALRREDAIVVAVGATAPAMEVAVGEGRGLVARLRVALVDAERPALRVDGALTREAAEAFARDGERRQIVVADPTKIAFGGDDFVRIAAQLDLRCEHPLHPVACTVAPRGPRYRFEPAAFLHAVAEATGLPAYDVYAGAEAM
jgi:hypothetical protein